MNPEEMNDSNLPEKASDAAGNELDANEIASKLALGAFRLSDKPVKPECINEEMPGEKSYEQLFKEVARGPIRDLKDHWRKEIKNQSEQAAIEIRQLISLASKDPDITADQLHDLAHALDDVENIYKNKDS